MKKTTIIFSMLLIVVWVLTGCSNVQTDDVVENGSYQAFIYDYSGSVSSANHKIEYVFADYDKYDDIVIDDRIECLINDISYAGKYQGSQYREYNYFPVHQYVDEKGISFEVDESGVLISCFWGNASLQGTKKTEDECVEIARDFLASIIDISDYDIAIKDNEERGLYTVKFTKSINGIKTTDTATIVVKKDGSLYSYSSFMLGRVSENGISFDAINLDKVKESINNKLNQVYKEAKGVYLRVDYGEPDIMLTMLKDGKVGVVCTVNVECVEVLGEFETSVSERISFVVMID